MKKLMIVTNHSYMLYRFRRELIEAMLKEYQVVILTPFVGHENDLQDLGCKCICTDVNRRGMNLAEDLKLLRSYAAHISREKPDAVITYSIKPNVYAGTVCRWKHIPYFANVQGLGTAFESKKLAAVVSQMYCYGLKKTGGVFFENEGDADEFRKRRIVNPDKIKVLAGAGINLDFYTVQPFPREESRHFLYLGRIMREKGMEEWFHAVKKLKAEYGNRITFDMVGFFEDDYREQVERLNQEGVITFHGFQSDPVPYYAGASCVVLPSYHEGMSNVLLEAAAMGRPVVTSDVPGCREAVVNGDSGLLCRAKDPEALYRSMKQMMDLPRETLVQMGLRGRAHMEENFEKQKVISENMAIIKAGMV